MVDAPKYFVDRSLGVYTVPNALREAGWSIVTMRERYGELSAQRLQDPDWIADATSHGEVLLCKDKQIAKRPAEARAIQASGARAFALGSGELTGPEMADRFLRNRAAIERWCDEPGPYVVSVGHDRLERLILHLG